MENRSGNIGGAAAQGAAAGSDLDKESRYSVHAPSSLPVLPVMVVDAEGRFLFVNDPALDYLGYSRDDLQDKSSSTVIAPDSLKQLSEPGVKKLEVEFCCLDDRRAWAEVYPTLLDDSSLQLLAFDITERKLENEQLAREKGFAESAVNSLPGIFYLIDPNGRFLRWNDNFKNISGYTDEEISRMHPRELFAEEDRAYIAEKMAEVIETGESSAERDLLSKDGTRTPYFFTGRRIAYNNKPCMVGMGIDISTMLQFEKESLKLASLVTSSSDSIVSVDFNGNIESWNEGAAALYGYEASEVIGRSMSLLIPPDRRKEESEIMARIRAGKRIDPFETVRLRRDGTVVPVSLTVSPIIDRNGNVIGASKIARDITRRKNTEEALRESEQRYRAFVKQSSEGIWRFEINDPIPAALPLSEQVERIFRDGYLAEFNLAIAKQYRLTDLDGLNGSSIRTLLPRAEESNQQLLEAFVRNDYQLSAFETRFIDDKNDEHFFINNLTGIVEDGKLTRIWGTRGDITTVKKAEHAYQESEVQLRQSQKVEALGRLAGGVAHDFNNFLAVIMLHVDMLNLQLPVDSPLRYRMSEIKSVTNNAAGMVKQLLAYGRKQTMQPQPAVLNQIITEFTKIIKPLIGENIEVELSLAKDLGVCFVDPHQITQILMNLAVNARDAMPKGGLIKFETSNREITERSQLHKAQPFGDYVKMTVTDSGIGMDALTRARIFEPFFTNKDAGKGTGLGLSTVYGIVKQSNGFIWVESEPGEGAVFDLYFPRISQPAKVVRPDSSETTVDTMPQGNETVLLVEDEVQIRRVAVEVLTVLGYEVFEAGNGEQAMQLAELLTQPIHLLLTDVVMPKMNGRDLADNLAASHPETAVLFMSGYTDDIIARQGILEEDVHFLGKPFTPRTLATKVREVLDSRPES
jgi:PAS domain S-box-containing protein